ncbi:MAG TPA: CGNR zinc finger domain-containing protein [Thermoanaerobaculia bacterium]|jgi:predicted RNA-binding Zn ribbon-like protein
MPGRRKSARSDSDPRWTSKLPPAPGELRIVQSFVNTADFARGTDLEGPEALVRWLAHWSLVPEDAVLDAADLERAIEVREALRALIMANHGAAASDVFAARLDRTAKAAPILVRFDPAGRTRFEAVADDLDGALARLFGIVAGAQLDGSWERLKVCSGAVCRTAFYDFSTNRSALYCHARCGYRASSLAHRHRNLKEVRELEAGRSASRRLTRRRRTRPS